MKTTILAALILTFSGFSNLTNSQSFEWAKQIGGPGEDVGQSITVDGSGNVYTTGVFTGTVDFDPGPNTFNLISEAFTDIYISKLDVNGNFLWAKQMGGSGTDYGLAITLDALGNIYTTGAFQTTVDFNPSSEIFSLTAAGGDDIFILKLDASGDFIWAKQMGGPGSERAKAITLDDIGNIYLTGGFYGTVDFDPGEDVLNVVSHAAEDIFILKLNADADLLWVKTMGGTFGDAGTSICLDEAGNVYTTGYFYYSTVDFDPSEAVFNLGPTGGEIFILKLDAEGEFRWAKNLAGTQNNTKSFIKIDNQGNIYTSGYFQGTADFDPGTETYNLTSAGSTDIFVMKLNADGNFEWVKQLGGSEGDYNNSLYIDATGELIISSQFRGTVDFDPGAGVANLTSNGLSDISILKLNNEGDFLSVNQIGGSNDEAITSLCMDINGNTYATGFFKETIDSDPSKEVVNLTSEGGRDIFILKLGITSNGIFESSNNSSVTMYPNPANDLLNFSSSVNVKTTNLLGQIINEANNVKTLDISEYSTGVYIVFISDNKGRIIQKTKIIKLKS